MKNNNGKIIRKLSVRSLQHNRTRNLFAVTAIALTCMLFTALTSMGVGIVQVAQEEIMREVGGRFHAGLKDATYEQMEKIVSDDRVKDSCWTIMISIADNIQKRQAEVRYTGMPQKTLEESFIKLEQGTYPEKENEVIVDTLVMDELRLPHEVGVTLPLEFQFMGETVKDTFTVSGWYEGDRVSHASMIYVSESYWKKLKGDLTDEDILAWNKAHPDNNGAGLYQVNMDFASAKNIEENIISIIRDAGYEPDTEISYGVNWAYMQNRLEQVDPATIMFLMIGLVIILLTGYLIIYNIFQISVYQDIRYYGLLKTVGTTKRQIRKLIRRQALILSGAGIPIGLAAGLFIGKVLFPFSMSFLDLSGMKITLHFSPVILVFSTIFSLATVFISCQKPGKIAGNVSPVEAVRYTEGSVRRKRQKKSETGARIHKMALSNLGRNKKKTALVIMSLSLSVILLCVVLTGISSFRLEAHLETRLVGDIQVASTNITGGGSGTRDYQLDMELPAMLDKQEGIISKGEIWESYGPDYLMLDDEALEKYRGYEQEGILRNTEEYQSSQIKNAIERHQISTGAYAYDTELLKKLKILKGEFDAEKFQQGGYILISPIMSDDSDDSCIYEPGDKVTVARLGENTEAESIEDEYGYITDVVWSNLEEVEYEVMAVVETIPPSLNDGGTPVNGVYMVFPKKDVAEGEHGYCIMVSYDVEEEALPDFIAAAKDYTENVNRYMGYMTRESLMQEFSNMINVIYVIGVALSAVIGLIGVLNFINSIFTGILARKREFAILCSIGMTQRQLKRMLIEEGIFYVVISGGISLVLGSALSYGIMQVLNNVAMFFRYQYNAMAFVIMIPLFAVLAAAVPYAAYTRAAKESVVERLRDTDS